MASQSTASHQPQRRQGGSTHESQSERAPVESTGSVPNPATDEADEVYGVVSVLYHALQGAENYSKYIEDARRAGDQDLIEFFQECRDDETDRASRAKELLAMRLGIQAADEAEDEDEEEDEDEDEEEEKAPRH